MSFRRSQRLVQIISMDQRLHGSICSAYRLQRYNISKSDWPFQAVSKEINLRDIDTIVFNDIVDGVRGEFAGEGADAHCGENGAACGEITPEGAV